MPDTAAITPSDHVTIVAECPSCDSTVHWHGIYRDPGGGTKWSILCDHCTPEPLR